mmetsp:Transcript_81173/g.210879  ORF Transcript_81173/g.210879 Transcript_81173/m.210879 type:complete len:228 (-) Transcript_81173:16-699(-)
MAAGRAASRALACWENVSAAARTSGMARRLSMACLRASGGWGSSTPAASPCNCTAKLLTASAEGLDKLPNSASACFCRSAMSGTETTISVARRATKCTAPGRPRPANRERLRPPANRRLLAAPATLTPAAASSARSRLVAKEPFDATAEPTECSCEGGLPARPENASGASATGEVLLGTGNAAAPATIAMIGEFPSLTLSLRSAFSHPTPGKLGRLRRVVFREKCVA